jgi:hypothetical protein
VLGGLLVVGAGLAAACLPDLQISTLCGNGHIDPPYETCDPGANPNPGCSADCEIVCSAPDGGGTFVDLNASNHCYATFPVPQNYDTGATTCGAAVDDNEVTAVVGALSTSLTASRFWVGVERTKTSGPYVALATNEPGWNVPGMLNLGCSGCFMYGVSGVLPSTSSIPEVDGGEGQQCVVAELSEESAQNARTSMEVMGPNEVAQVVCEREPVGARSVGCFDGSFCFNVLATIASSKAYVYNPNPMTAPAAGEYCRRLTDAGKGSSLVILESRAEREQVIYELSQLRSLGGAPPIKFWIGLHTEPIQLSGDAGADGGDAGIAWVWDDMVVAPPLFTSTSPRPSVWGDSQPAPGVVVGTAYIDLEGDYDTGLARAGSEDVGSAPALTNPFVCQY